MIELFLSALIHIHTNFTTLNKYIFIFCFFSILFPNNSWMVYDDSEVSTINIEIDPQSLSWIYDSENLDSDSLHMASFHFQNAYINEHIDSIGFRIRGNTSRNADKKSFKIDFNHFVQGRQFYDIEKMNLNGEHNDPSVTRSKICWDIFQKIDIPSSQASHTEVYINDNYYGLYVSVEHIDDNFLERNFSDDSGNLWKCIWPADLTYRGDNPISYHPYYSDTRPYELKTNEEEYDFTQLARLIRIINQDPDSLEHILNVKQVLQYLAINLLTGSWDDYRYLKNNFYLYYEPDNDIFHWIPFDYDNSFGVDWFDESWSSIDPYSYANIDGTSRPLTDYIFQNEKYVNLFTHFLEFYADRFINNEKLDQRLDSLKSMLFDSVVEDNYYTFDYGFSIQDFENSFSYDFSNQHVKTGLKEFIQQRNSSLNGQLSYQISEPFIYEVKNIADIQTLNTISFLNVSVFSNEGIDEVIFHYKNEESEWDSYHFYPNPINESNHIEEVDRWSLTIENGVPGSVDWYITALSNALIGRYPKYGYENYTVVQTSSPEILINEIMAINDSTVQDENGEYDDWIELFNSSNDAISLQGYFFSDNKNNLNKWQVLNSNAIINAGESVIIWCDDDEEQGSLHTNFKLSGNGEFISITASDGVTVLDSITFPAMQADISYGRIHDGAMEWGFMSLPTPGEENLVLSLMEDIVIPKELNIVSAFPNPFNSNISMKIQSNVIEEKIVKVYNIKGEIVYSDFINLNNSGEVIWQWNGSDHNGLDVGSGTYIIQVSTNNNHTTKKVSLIK